MYRMRERERERERGGGTERKGVREGKRRGRVAAMYRMREN